MLKLYYLYVFFLITSLFFSYSTRSMESRPLKSHSLNWRDQQIFLYEIERVGIKDMKEQLGISYQTKHNFEYLHCLIIVELKLYPSHKNVLTKILYEAVAMKENAKNYIPNQDNFLSDYTQYWHEEDDNKDYYIRYKSIFTEQKELEKILIQFENAFKKQSENL